ncbi:MAG: cobalamin biosynthesis protein, partial [Symploca sp. SIO2G7]|nr:cobalamin biosynthesis protein [Symploca sp. SIO2G7]
MLVTSNTAAIVLLLAASLDYLIGDPWNWPHPVRVMGWLISLFTQLVIKYWHQKWKVRLAGIGLGAGLIIGSGAVGWLIVQGASWINSGLGVVLESILLASCFAGRSLRVAAVDVLQPLTTEQLEQARSRLGQYVGRDTEKLTEPE